MPQNEIRITVVDGHPKQAGEMLSAVFSDEVTIGRSSSSDIVLRDTRDQVSKCHFRIFREGEAVMLLNLGKNRTSVNDKVLAKDAKVAIAVGDSVKVADHVHFRFDALGDAQAPDDAPTGDVAMSETRATRSTDAKSMSMTRPTLSTDAKSMSMTRPTVAAEAVAVSGTGTQPLAHSSQAVAAVSSFDAPSEPGTGTETRPMPETKTRPMTKTRTVDFAARSISVTPADRVSALTKALTEKSERPTGYPVTDDSDSVTTGGGEDRPTEAISATDAATNDRTRGSKTRPASPGDQTDVFDFDAQRLAEIRREQRERYRRIFLGLVVGAFLAGVGVLIWRQWPRPEEYLTSPKLAGMERPDYAHQALTDKNGQRALVAFYPRDRRMRERKTEDGGLEVSTVLGRDRDVSFWLRYTRRDDPSELNLSLEESVSRILADAQANEQMTFFKPPEWEGSDYCFLESEYPGSGHDMMRGTRIYRTEYRVKRQGEDRHGVMFILRSFETVWKVEHDVSEREWERAKIALRINSNMEWYGDYLANRWESPGKSQLDLATDLPTLFAEAAAAIETYQPLKSDWTRLDRVLDSLVYRTFSGPDAERKRARKLLAKFRAIKDIEYNYFVLKYKEAERSKKNGKDIMAAASDKCRSVFGSNPRERYRDLIGNPEEWKCQKK